jgi:hypothetical protein
MLPDPRTITLASAVTSARPARSWHQAALSQSTTSSEKAPASLLPVDVRGATSCGRDHRGAAGVHGVDDLGVVDALQVDRGDAEVGVSELPLDDVRGTPSRASRRRARGAVGVARSAVARPLARGVPQLGARRGGRPRPAARRTVDDAEQRSDRQLNAGLEPGRELSPGPVMHPDLAAAAPLAVPYQYRPAARVQVGFGERGLRGCVARLATAQQSGRAAACRERRRRRGAAHHVDDLLDRRRSAGYRIPCCAAGGRLERTCQASASHRRPALQQPRARRHGSPASSRASDGGRRHRATARTRPLLGRRRTPELPPAATDARRRAVGGDSESAAAARLPQLEQRGHV